jgi:hypothetical protein
MLAVSDQLGAIIGTGRPLEIYWHVLSSAHPFYRREITFAIGRASSFVNCSLRDIGNLIETIALLKARAG